MPGEPRWQLNFQTWLRLLALGLVIWFIIGHFDLIAELAGVLFGAFLLSLAIRPLADRLAHQRVPRWLTVLYVYIGVAAILAILASLLRPVVGMDLASLQGRGPHLTDRILHQLSSIPFVNQWLPSGAELARQFGAQVGAYGRPLFSALTSLGSLLLDVLLVLVLGFFFATDMHLTEDLIRTLVPRRHRSHAAVFMADVSGQLTRWVWAQLGIGLYFAVAFSSGLLVLHVPYAVTIGIIGGALEIIPYVGGLVAVLLGVFSALTRYPLLALWVVVLHLLVSFVESHIIAPAFYGRVMHLHPAVVLLALFVGAKLAGVPGVLFAVPVTVVVVAILEEAHAVQVTPRAPLEAPSSEEKV